MKTEKVDALQKQMLTMIKEKMKMNMKCGMLRMYLVGKGTKLRR